MIEEQFIPGATQLDQRPTIEYIIPAGFWVQPNPNGGPSLKGVKKNQRIFMPVDNPPDEGLVEHIERCEKFKGMKYVTHYDFPIEYYGEDNLMKRRAKAYRDLDAYLKSKPKHEGQKQADNGGREVGSEESSEGGQSKSSVRTRAKAGEKSELRINAS